MRIKTKKEFEKYFRREFLPLIKEEEKKYGPGIDRPLRREEWNNMIAMWVESKELPPKALSWDPPW